MRKQLFLVIFIAALGPATDLPAAPPAGASAVARAKPNIVYVLADQWRAKSTGYEGNPDVKTPNLDRLAGQALNFRNTVSVAPVCTPYRAALMTGRFPLSTGMVLNDLHLPSEHLCMAEIFKAAGYDSAYIGKWHLDGHGRRAFIPPERRQGWEYWKAAECDHNNRRSHYYTGDSPELRFWEGYDALAQTRDAQAYIQARAAGGKPFILMLSFGPPHPASPPAPDRYKALYNPAEFRLPPNVPAARKQEARAALHQYYALCTTLDDCVGDLEKTLDEAGIADNTIFIFTSDHGGMLFSHGIPAPWKQVAWDESARVPFLLRYPAAHGRAGRTVETPLTTPDILPTLLGLAGIPVPEVIEGDDLSPLVLEGGERDRSALYMSATPFRHGIECYRAIRTSRHTFIRYLDGTLHLFDDRRDPFQMENLAGRPEHRGLLKEMEQRLAAELERVGDEFLPPDRVLEMWGLDVPPGRPVPTAEGDTRTVYSPARKVRAIDPGKLESERIEAEGNPR
jgi:arylsulfatase A-like enzyme